MTLRERQARAEIRARGAALLLAIDNELDDMFHVDADTWAQAHAVADAIIADARVRVDKACADMGIPKWARPEVDDAVWFRRGWDAVRERRARLRGIADQRVADLERRARLIVVADVDELVGWNVVEVMPLFTAAELEATR